MTAVVLVHGGWHGAWCWERVAAGLFRRGVRAVAVDLPGHGADPGPFTDLHGDAARVGDVLDGLDQSVVLVGHSYGGAVVTEAGDHTSVKHLVYIAGFALDAGEACTRAAADEPATARISWEGRPDLGAAFITGPDGKVTLEPSAAAACLYNDCDDDTVRWALARLGPQPLLNLQQEPRSVAWRNKPATYVVCSEDLGVHPDLERILARRCASRLEWPTGHSPSLSRSDLVVELLAERAAMVDDGQRA